MSGQPLLEAEPGCTDLVAFPPLTGGLTAMQASAAETARLGGELSLVRKPGYDYRPIVVGTSYLVLYLILDWIAEMLGSACGLNHWHLTA
jgi:hypothetical protein